MSLGHLLLNKRFGNVLRIEPHVFPVVPDITLFINVKVIKLVGCCPFFWIWCFRQRIVPFWISVLEVCTVCVRVRSLSTGVHHTYIRIRSAQRSNQFSHFCTACSGMSQHERHPSPVVTFAVLVSVDNRPQLQERALEVLVISHHLKWHVVVVEEFDHVSCSVTSSDVFVPASSSSPRLTLHPCPQGRAEPRGQQVRPWSTARDKKSLNTFHRLASSVTSRGFQARLLKSVCPSGAVCAPRQKELGSPQKNQLRSTDTSRTRFKTDNTLNLVRTAS